MDFDLGTTKRRSRCGEQEENGTRDPFSKDLQTHSVEMSQTLDLMSCHGAPRTMTIMSVFIAILENIRLLSDAAPLTFLR